MRFGWCKTLVNFIFKEKKKVERVDISLREEFKEIHSFLIALLFNLTSLQGVWEFFQSLMSNCWTKLTLDGMKSHGVCCVSFASGDYSVMMWKIKITIFEVYISQSKYL